MAARKMAAKPPSNALNVSCSKHINRWEISSDVPISVKTAESAITALLSPVATLTSRSLASIANNWLSPASRLTPFRCAASSNSAANSRSLPLAPKRSHERSPRPVLRFFPLLPRIVAFSQGGLRPHKWRCLRSRYRWAWRESRQGIRATDRKLPPSRERRCRYLGGT